jgi:hypothetical protein
MASLSNFTTLNVVSTTATVLNGQSESSIIYTQGTTALRIGFPAAWTGGDVKFAVSYDGGATFKNAAKNADGINFVLTATAASDDYVIEPWWLAGATVIKLLTPAQAADRVLSLSLRKI